MKFKIGDKVKTKSLKGRYDHMDIYSNRNAVITQAFTNQKNQDLYYIDIDFGFYVWGNEMMDNIKEIRKNKLKKIQQNG